MADVANVMSEIVDEAGDMQGLADLVAVLHHLLRPSLTWGGRWGTTDNFTV